MSADRRLAIVIVTHNSSGSVGSCLRSLSSGVAGLEVETVVVDSASTDGTPELIERDFPGVRLVRAANRGYAAGLNLGIEETEGPWLLLANPDLELVEGDLADLVDRLEREPEIGLAGVRQLDDADEPIPTMRRRPGALRALADGLGAERLPRLPLGERELRLERYARETDCDWTSGSFMLCRRAALEAVGGLDESFFLYCEETDLALRLRAAGWRIVHLPGATVVHHEKGSSGDDPRYEAQAAHSRLRLARKHLPAAHGLLYRLALAIGYAARARRPAARHGLAVTLGRAGAPFEAERRDAAPSDPNRAMVKT